MRRSESRRARWVLGALAVLVAGGLGLFGGAMSRDAAPPPAALPSAAEPTPSEPIAEAGPSGDDPLVLATNFADFKLLDPDVGLPVGVAGVVPTLSDLSMPLTQRTMRYVEHFGVDPKGRKSFEQRFKRGARYRDFIERQLLEAGLPQDLVWVAAIESGFRPQATSPVGAAGLYQLMPDTAIRFGLVVGTTVDERRSIARATSAAMDYLESLYDRFGAWDLALAAYNCGEGCVDDALTKASAQIGEREDPIAFHELAELRLLPRETAEFVPQIQAFAIVAQNRAQLALDDFEVPSAMHFAEVAVPAGTPIAWVGRAADMTISELREYNPELLADTVGDGQGDVIVQVPADRLAQTMAALPGILFGRDAKKPSAGDDEDAEEATPEPTAEPEPTPVIKLTPVPDKPGSFLLSSGVVVELIKTKSKDIEISAKAVQRDAQKADKVRGEIALPSSSTQRGLFEQAVRAAQRDLVAAVRSDLAPKLYDGVRAERRTQYEKTGDLEAFSALSKKMFRPGHPLAGQLLAGTTKAPGEVIVDLEPAWTIEATFTLRGNVDADRLGPTLEDVLKEPLAPTRLPRLPVTGQVLVVPDGPNRLIGWGSHPFAAEEEAAARIAFTLACHGRLGRLTQLLARDKEMVKSLDCAMERAPSGSVVWVKASPQGKHTGDDLERSVLEALVGLTGIGPSEDELDGAKDVLRAELTRRRVQAAAGANPRRALLAACDRVLEHLDDTNRAQVIDAARKLFSIHHRVTVNF